tara:strand:+ start:151 stop:2400 length:2250 start_codon:yes stop_codon:yes gene_type:complete
MGLKDDVNTGYTLEEYNERKKKFEEYKDTLPKEPSGSDVKKEYCVCCFQKNDWEFVHEELIKDGSTESNIPTEKCECVNDCNQSDVRGVHLLTDTEADELRNNPKVNYVTIKATKYPGTYKINPDDVSYESRVYRYSSTVKSQMDVVATSGGLLENYNSDKLNRCSSQLYRGTTKKNPWVTTGNAQDVIQDRIYQYATGKDVDVIVCDQSCWFGHIEFCNPSGITDIKTYNGSNGPGANSSTVAPSNYIGGNVLKSGYSASATTGVCDVLDLVLDAPYYIDPAWFETDASNRLTLRWDGTTVPVESVAKSWWSNSTQRSSQFANAGTVTIPTDYTRDNNNGTNTTMQATSGETHGTPCASQTYGRQYGWAYNANKWYLNLYGSTGFDLNADDGFDIQKIFHQVKPNRSSDNTKNPTVSSNSWGSRFSPYTQGLSGYYWHRPATTDGTTSGTYFTSSSYTWMGDNTDGTNNTPPRFMSNRYLTSGDSIGYFSGFQLDPVSGPSVTAIDELINSGVIWVVASGNHNTKQVKSDHPDYNNYFATNNNTALNSSLYYSSYYLCTFRKTINRPGFPNGINDKCINVGALDYLLSSGKERKVNYSTSGNYLDLYAPAHFSLSATNKGSIYPRYDSYYTYDSSQSYISGDQFFSGTSSACPIAAGLIATKLEKNRSWTSADIKSWLTSSVGEQDSADFYTGSEGTTVNDSSWSDKNSIQGSTKTVIWDAISSGDLSYATIIFSGSGLSFSGSFTIS